MYFLFIFFKLLIFAYYEKYCLMWSIVLCAVFVVVFLVLNTMLQQAANYEQLFYSPALPMYIRAAVAASWLNAATSSHISDFVLSLPWTEPESNACPNLHFENYASRWESSKMEVWWGTSSKHLYNSWLMYLFKTICLAVWGFVLCSP